MLWLCSPLIVLSLELCLLELGGKDVEDLFTAVLSPAATQPASVPQPPAPPLLPAHAQGMSPLEKCCKYGSAVCAPQEPRTQTDGRKPSFVPMEEYQSLSFPQLHTCLPDILWKSAILFTARILLLT